MTDLKNCPFCGGNPLFTGSEDGLEGIVECLDLDCPNDSGYDVEAWQNRAPSPLDEAREAVVEAIEAFQKIAWMKATDGHLMMATAANFLARHEPPPPAAEPCPTFPHSHEIDCDGPQTGVL